MPDAVDDPTTDEPTAEADASVSHPTSDDGSDGADVLGALSTAGNAAYRFLAVLARIVFVGLGVGVSFLRETERDDPVRDWFLLGGSRLLIVGAMTLSFFLAVLFLGATDVIGLAQPEFVVEMFSTVIAGLFSFIAVVVAVNSLSMTGLSNSLSGIQDRVDSVEEFRRDVARLADDVVVTPTDPAGFLDVVSDALDARARDLDDALGSMEEPARSDVAAVAAELRASVDRIEAGVGGDPAVFEVLVPMMHDDYSRDVNRIHQLLRIYEEAPEPVRTNLTEAKDLLETLDVSRTYFKTMFLQQELASTSRQVAYAGIHGLVWAMFVIMVFANGQPSVDHGSVLLFMTSFGMAAAFLPFAVLIVNVVRVATVIKRTSAPGAFTPGREEPEYAT